MDKYGWCRNFWKQIKLKLHQNILYDFKPPGKQYDLDINTRSGGEKSMAGLALIFSMAIDLYPKPPHMILLDEVDAHLD